MQQSSVIPSVHLDFGGCRRLLHAFNPPHSAFLFQQFLARCHPYILLHFYTCILAVIDDVSTVSITVLLTTAGDVILTDSSTSPSASLTE